jgi:hypothetical protein
VTSLLSTSQQRDQELNLFLESMLLKSVLLLRALVSIRLWLESSHNSLKIKIVTPFLEILKKGDGIGGNNFTPDTQTNPSSLKASRRCRQA